eukprot:TRINITY_DN9960_c0_g1_i1.p1 TRINITY_DN9960_c0_g1~~TRINITY_DN9960_c0_g1_i1.p1  ORF type:complete len:1446 (+),score=372.90 TRINITY_DN9960_c0_g1_i1:92-4339(+)
MRTIEQTYQKKSQLEHVLLRPDTYIGSVEKDTVRGLWIVNEEELKMEQRNLRYVPGLYKIFDEILVNAADNKVRDPTMNLVKVDIDQKENVITVWNNGKGLPVEIHKEHNIYVPELVFGHLLTSSNYDDSQKKITGGRNGFGAKLTNIYSTEFTVETYDSNTGKLYSQTWRKNMTEMKPPRIKEVAGKADFTSITFKPDLGKFSMEELEDDIVLLMKKRVYDLAGTSDPSLKVKLNGRNIPITDFKAYCKMYPIAEDMKNLQFERINDRWSVCIAASNLSFQQVSFVNHIWTLKGGKHVEHITKQIVDHIAEKLKKKKIEFKPQVAKNFLWVFVNGYVENPAFDSQTKENLTTNVSKFGSPCVLSDKVLDAVMRSAIVQRIIDAASLQTLKTLDKKTGGKSKKLDIPKLEDANEAGRKRAGECTLIITEGDSAKALAVAGLSVVGRDLWGVFPLRGKLLNVREAAPSQILGNKEIQHLMQILGLKTGEKYEDSKKLRYGHLMIMTDQDHDGSHIKGLVINFIHYFWPSLLDLPGFLVEFITPILKATQASVVKSFFSLKDFHDWAATVNTQKWKIKYYKGLGTSDAREGKEYFMDLPTHKIDFVYDGAEDNDALLLAFDKHKADERKLWLSTYRGDTIDYKVKRQRVRDFVNKELVLFSIADCERSIPSVVDGFKPTQRKILYGCFFKRIERKEIKVSQLTGIISADTAYHHGEASLQSTIVGMAQDFVGANNVNLLAPNGQFGTRDSGGKNCAQARYIFTQLTPMARALFPAVDDELLDRKSDDGKLVEPHWYLPIIPTVLVNGTRGIGTGYASFIPNFNPADLIAAVRLMLKGEPCPSLVPWYRGFTGRIAAATATSYKTYGVAKRVAPCVVNVTELPVGMWTEDFKETLRTMLQEEIIADFREHHTDTTVDFEIAMCPETIDEWEASSGGLVERFKLVNSLSTNNMVAFDRAGKLTRYADVRSIVKEFFELRLQYYGKRKQRLVDTLNGECEKLKNMVRFVLEVIGDELRVAKRKKKELLADLKRRGYKAFPPARRTPGTEVDDNEPASDNDDDDQAEATGTEATAADYDYLLGMKIWNLTVEKVEKLQEQLRRKEGELKKLLETTPEQLWEADLDNFETVWCDFERKRLAAPQVRRDEKGAKIAPAKGKGKAALNSTQRLADTHIVPPKRSEKAEKLSKADAAKQEKKAKAEASKEEREAKKAEREQKKAEREQKREGKLAQRKLLDSEDAEQEDKPSKKKPSDKVMMKESKEKPSKKSAKKDSDSEAESKPVKKPAKEAAKKKKVPMLVDNSDADSDALPVTKIGRPRKQPEKERRKAAESDSDGPARSRAKRSRKAVSYVVPSSDDEEEDEEEKGIKRKSPAKKGKKPAAVASDSDPASSDDAVLSSSDNSDESSEDEKPVKRRRLLPQ